MSASDSSTIAAQSGVTHAEHALGAGHPVDRARHRATGWALFAVLALVYAGVVFGPFSGFPKLVLLELIHVVPIAVTVVLGYRLAVRTSGVERSFWALLSTANLMLLACEALLVLWIAAIDSSGPPAVSPPFHALHAIAAVCFVGALLSMTRFGEGTTTTRLRYLLDFFSVALLCYMLVLGLFAVPVMSQVEAPVSHTLLGAGYPLVGLLLILGTLVNVVGFKVGKWRSWEKLTTIALAVYAAAISLWPLWYTSVTGTSRNLERGMLDLVQLAGHWVLMMAVIYRMTEPGTREMLPLPALSLTRERRAATFVPIVALVAIPLLGYQAWGNRGDQEWFAVYVAATTALTAGVLGRSLLLTLEHSTLFQRSITDPLTRVYNHRFFHDRLPLEFDRAVRYGDRLSLIALDLDDFGAANEQYGHEGGDQLLRSVGERLRALDRPGLIVARLGGDEFALLLPEAGEHEAQVLAQRVVDMLSIEAGFTPGQLTVSAGVASYPETANDRETLVRQSDGALFHAKATGKNRVVVYDPHRVPDLSAAERIERLEWQSRTAAVRALAAAVDARDATTMHHSEQVAALVVRLGRYLGLDEDHVSRLELAALVHDVGKIGVPDSVLLKTCELSGEEWASIRSHPVAAQQILNSTQLHDVLPWVRHHHERWDGTGYPEGLAGDAIPLEARLLAVCDAYDAMVSVRAYRPPLTSRAALLEIDHSLGTQFDPRIAEAFIRMVCSETGECRDALPS